MAAERLEVNTDSLTSQSMLMNELMNAAMEPTFAKLGIKANTFDLLSTIHAAGADATQAEIARRLGVKPPSLTEALRGIKHLVEQVGSERDSRVKNLVLTNSGRAALVECVQALNRIAKNVASGIERDQLRNAVDVLKRANRSLAQSLGGSK